MLLIMCLKCTSFLNFKASGINEKKYSIRRPNILFYMQTNCNRQNQILSMVLISDGNSEHVAYVWRKKGIFGGKTLDLSDQSNLIKCLK